MVKSITTAALAVRETIAVTVAATIVVNTTVLETPTAIANGSGKRYDKGISVGTGNGDVYGKGGPGHSSNTGGQQ